jgi:hypothetical protein
VAPRGARAAADDAGDRLSQREISRAHSGTPRPDVPAAQGMISSRAATAVSNAKDAASRYVSAILMIGRGLSIGGLEDSCASKISVRPTRSYSAEIVLSQ